MDKYWSNELSLERRAQNTEMFRCAFEAAAEKLHKYVAQNGQPAIKFLKAVRILDPSRVCVVSHDSKDYSAIPHFGNVLSQEFNLYVNKLAPDAVTIAGSLWSAEKDVEVFWLSMSEGHI